MTSKEQTANVYTFLIVRWVNECKRMGTAGLSNDYRNPENLAGRLWQAVETMEEIWPELKEISPA